MVNLSLLNIVGEILRDVPQLCLSDSQWFHQASWIAGFWILVVPDLGATALCLSRHTIPCTIPYDTIITPLLPCCVSTDWISAAECPNAQRFAQQTQKKVGLRSFDIIWASLSLEALHRVGLIEFQRRHVTNEYNWVRKQVCWPLMNDETWWNYEMMNALPLRFPMNTQWKFEVHKHLPDPDPFNCYFCWMSYFTVHYAH